MRASLIQIAVDPDESVNSRRQRAASLVRQQRGADLVVLPELWPVGAFAYESFAAEAETLDGPTFQEMSKAARDAGVWLHAGSIVERAPEAVLDGAADLYNTALVIAPDGSLVRSYRKIHRFGFDKGEATLMGAGDELVTVALPDAVMGLATCYDLRFPELFRGLLDEGAQVFVVPAGWRPAAAPTGRCWRRRARWRTRRMCSPARPPARTPGWSSPGTASWSTPGARCWRRRGPARRS